MGMDSLVDAESQVKDLMIRLIKAGTNDLYNGSFFAMMHRVLQNKKKKDQGIEESRRNVRRKHSQQSSDDDVGKQAIKHATNVAKQAQQLLTAGNNSKVTKI